MDHATAVRHASVVQPIAELVAHLRRLVGMRYVMRGKRVAIALLIVAHVDRHPPRLLCLAQRVRSAAMSMPGIRGMIMTNTMKLLALCFTVALISGCATQKVSLKDLQDYNKAIQIAEQEHLDTTDMHKHLVEMFISYMKHPGQDPYLKAMQDQAHAQQAQAMAAALQNIQMQQQLNNQPIPLSPLEYQRAIGQ